MNPLPEVSMSEQERIQALLQAGKITQQEADLLLSALDDGDAARQADPTLNETVGQPQYAPPASSGQTGWQPQGLRWARVKLTAGQLEVRLDPSLQMPVVEGQAEVRQVGSDLEITPSTVNSSFLGGLLGRQDSLELRLPAGWGLDLDGKAVQVEVEGVAFLKGRVAVGNVELSAVQGIDLEVTAGNLEGALLLCEGQHRLRVSMGNAELDLLPGSSVQLRPGVSMGNLEIKGFSRSYAADGSEVLQVGEGKATLEVSVRMGNLEVKAR
jgi:hypothetical protein